jgi:hypothetical protein
MRRMPQAVMIVCLRIETSLIRYLKGGKGLYEECKRIVQARCKQNFSI